MFFFVFSKTSLIYMIWNTGCSARMFAFWNIQETWREKAGEKTRARVKSFEMQVAHGTVLLVWMQRMAQCHTVLILQQFLCSLARKISNWISSMKRGSLKALRLHSSSVIRVSSSKGPLVKMLAKIEVSINTWLVKLCQIRVTETTQISDPTAHNNIHV